MTSSVVFFVRKTMDDLRKHRLLSLATKPKNHKYFYSQYRKLEFEGLVWWQFGFAHLTMDGYKWLVNNSYLRWKNDE